MLLNVCHLKGTFARSSYVEVAGVLMSGGSFSDIIYYAEECLGLSVKPAVGTLTSDPEAQIHILDS